MATRKRPADSSRKSPAEESSPDVASATRPVIETGLSDRAVAIDTSVLARSFLPSLDLESPGSEAIGRLSDDDKRQILLARAADVTHFRVALGTLHDHARIATELIDEVRVLPRRVRGLALNPDRSPAARVSVQPALPDGGVLGRGVVTDEIGVFDLPLPDVTAAQRRTLLHDGLGLRFTGASNVSDTRVVAVPSFGRAALGELSLGKALQPLPQGIIGALLDLVDGIEGSFGDAPDSANHATPVTVALGQDACNIRFEQDAVVRRFPYKMLVRLVEPRTTTVKRVFLPKRTALAHVTGTRELAITDWNHSLSSVLATASTRFVDRVPVDKPVSVDGFRDQLIGVRGNTIGVERTVPIAGTLGLGYVLNLAQVWKYQGLTLGNLLYSLPLAPGEQQRIAVSERVATASVRDSERLDVSERQHSALREDASTEAVFESAFEEHVSASSSYSNKARSSSWGVAGGIGAVLGPVALGIGAGGGGGKSSNSGSTRSALDGARTYASSAAEQMHRNVERQAAARRTAQRSSIRLATETDRETVTTRVIANHNKMHALTIQYWEVLRKFIATTEVEGVNLVCFIPLDVVRFLPAGQQLELTDTSRVDTRAEVLARYAMLHRHADAIQPSLPQRHREGLRILEDFAANPRSEVNVAGPAANLLTFSLSGRFIPYERLSVRVLLRNGRSLGPVALDSPLTAIEARQFGTKDAFLQELKRLRSEAARVNMTGSLLIPQSVDPSEIVAFEVRRWFDTIVYELDIDKHPFAGLFGQPATQPFPWPIAGPPVASSIRLVPSELEREIGGPFVRDFQARIDFGSSIAADSISSDRELPPSGLPIAAVERNPTLSYRDLMKIERTAQHVVRNTLVYSKAVWASLTPEERVVMLEGYTIGLPETGLDADGLNDPSQHVPLLNCIGNQVLGYYGNCMVVPFSIPAALAVALAGDPDADDADSRAPLTNAAVQESLTLFHREAFAPPQSHFTLPTRGVLGEAVLGHCAAAEKIDLTRFWNWQDSPGPEATAIDNVGFRANSLAGLSAPSTLSSLPTIVNNVAGEGGSTLGTLAQALAGKAPAGTSFSTDFLGHDVLTALGGKTIDSAESARKDALASATQLAGKALDAGVDVFKTKLGADKAAKEKSEADKKAATAKTAADAAAAAKATSEKQLAAVKTLRDNAPAFLGVAGSKADATAAREFATGVINGLAGGPLPPELAARLFDVYDKTAGTPPVRTTASQAWLTALGLI
jgi:hypothetical protein